MRVDEIDHAYLPTAKKEALTLNVKIVKCLSKYINNRNIIKFHPTYLLFSVAAVDVSGRNL